MTRRHHAALKAATDSRPAINEILRGLRQAAKEVPEGALEADPAFRLLVLALAQRVRAYELQGLTPYVEALVAVEEAVTVVSAPSGRSWGARYA